MADKIRVLYRVHFGIPWRQASDDEKKLLLESLDKISKKWKSSGMKLIGTFSSFSQPDSFFHYSILEVDDIEKVWEMNSDVVGSQAGKYIEKYDFHVGKSNRLEDNWDSL